MKLKTNITILPGGAIFPKLEIKLGLLVAGGRGVEEDGKLKWARKNSVKLRSAGSHRMKLRTARGQVRALGVASELLVD